MTLYRATETLAEHWDEVIGYLSGEQQRALEGLLRTLLDSEDVYVRDEVAADLLDLVTSALPAGHPVRRAFAGTDAVRSVRGAEDGDDWTQALVVRLRAALGDGGGRTVVTRPSADATTTTDGFDIRPRYLKGRCPESVAVGKSFSLLVSVVLTAGPGQAELESFPVPPTGRDIDLIADAPGLRVLGDRQQTVSVPADADSRPVRFEFRADTAGPRQVSVTAWIGGSYLGELRAEITAERDGRGEDTDRDVLAEIATEAAEGAVSLVVRYDPGHQTYRFEFRDDDNPDEVTSHLAYDPGPIVERLVADLDGLAQPDGGYSGTQTHAYLVNAGARLWRELVPGQLREQFWERRHRIRQLTILADHDTVPWELLYPRDSGRDAGFLVEQFPVTRAMFGRRLGRRLSLRPSRFVLAEGSLPQAQREIDVLRRLLDPDQPAGSVIADVKTLLDLIQNGNFGLLHFACHNGFDIGRGSSITMDSGLFTPTLMTTAAIDQVLGRTAPTIFMNACRSAGLAATYNRLDGWASMFLEAGATAFIGSLWAVRDRTAREFAEEFYQQLHGGCPLGEAMMRARQVMAAERPNDPAWLAYTVYGNPGAMVSGPHAGPA